MSLDDLEADVQQSYTDLGEEFPLPLDRESRNELALLTAAYRPEDPDELVRRAVHLLFQSAVETGKLDFQLRSSYDVTYDEYLSGMTYDEMAGGTEYPQRDDDRRYQF